MAGELADAMLQLPPAQDAALAGEKEGDVFRYRQGGDERKVLKDHAYAHAPGGGGGAGAQGASVNGYGSGVGGVVSVDDFHQRAFAGAVFAEDGVDFAAAQG